MKRSRNLHKKRKKSEAEEGIVATEIEIKTKMRLRGNFIFI